MEELRIGDLSKSFKPNFATIQVLSMGTKFIPKWKQDNTKNTCRNFENFWKKLNNTVYFKGTSQDFLKETKISNSNPLLTHLKNIMRCMNFASGLGTSLVLVGTNSRVLRKNHFECSRVPNSVKSKENITKGESVSSRSHHDRVLVQITFRIPQDLHPPNV